MESFKGEPPGTEKTAELERASLRNVYRREYQRNIQNPAFTGVLLDPAVKRWNYARVNSYNFFRPTPKTAVLGILFGVVPPALLMFIVKYRKNKREAAYKDGTLKVPLIVRL